MIFLDACIVIYRVEAVMPFVERLQRTLLKLRGSGSDVAVSDLSRLECRILPLRNRQRGLVEAYDAFFAAPDLRVVSLLPPVIDLATAIRARSGLRTPDALQAASCLSLGRPARFVTADAAFRREPALDVVLI